MSATANPGHPIRGPGAPPSGPQAADAGPTAATPTPAAPAAPQELERLRERLQEAEETLRAIRLGEVDALVVQSPEGPRTYTLVSADQSYRMLVEQISEAALTLTAEGLILYSNGRLQELLGWSGESLAGRLLLDLAPEESRGAVVELLGRALRQRAAGEVMLQRADGRLIPFHLSLSPLATGSFTGISAVATDLTEQKQREHAAADERLTRAVLEFAGTAIAVCDPAGRVLRVNRRATEAFGDELTDRTYDDAFPDGPRFADVIGPPLREELRETAYRTADGKVRYAVVSARRIGEGVPEETANWVVILSDVTHRKDVEAERVRLLEAERLARANAESANQAKTQFLAVMSHELRTPLSAVIGYADLMTEGIGGPPNPTQALYIDRIKLSAWHLLSLIEGILSFARVEAGKETVRIASTDVAAIAAEVVSVMEGQAEAKGIQLRARLAQGVPAVATDPAKLRQILLNLLGNAVKFTEQGSVELVVERSGSYALCHVRDTGPGISAEDIQRFFEPFVQGDQSNTRRSGGTGLGLTIARNFANMIGAEITVQSRPGIGSTFTLRLPVEGHGSGITRA
jgi:PAS domain S-box-containing protein